MQCSKTAFDKITGGNAGMTKVEPGDVLAGLVAALYLETRVDVEVLC